MANPSLSRRLRAGGPVWLREASGFTLFELIIVMSIIVVLAAIALPMYQQAVLHARETSLRDNLYTMRKMIDQYAADKGTLPQSLDDLASAGYIREIPEDPITQQKDWNVVMGDDPNSPEGGQGVIDVRSSSSDISTEGTPYNTW
jgi:general secretion pathway protein G